jgi:hypothetical protein
MQQKGIKQLWQTKTGDEMNIIKCRPHSLIKRLGLRYRLLWTQVRLRNGKIALFILGYLLLFLALAVFARGGTGAAMVSIHSGKAEQVAAAVLGICFLCATLCP